ncbi:MAG TPA: tetratricopeptide repeat protein [Candidatus Limnocylindria bacterium]|nr:tetratricopeptide repeat protein [Candidatus Limnocylindria bacterium]
MSQPNDENPQRASPGEPPSRVSAGSGARRWLFRLLAVLLVPMFLLAGVEGVLRLVEVGRPTGFFLKKTIKGQPAYVENGDFGLRFFPAELARTPSPLVMSATKPAGTYRVFVLGESAALGDPEPAFGFGRFLESLLRERFPGQDFEIVCTAMTAINSHVILPIARDCARQQGDLWVVYMGNNEFVGPFGPGTVFGAQTPSLDFIRADIALKRLRIVQWLETVLKRGNGDPKRSAAWGGMKMFLDHQVPPTDPRKEITYRYYERNLQDIIAVARQSGAKVVVSTVGSNIKDCPPFASTNAPTLTAASVAQWQQLYDAGRSSIGMGDYAGAAAQFKSAAKLDDTHAALRYRLGRCQLMIENREEAAHEFAAARDNDSLPFRADTRINKIIADVAQRGSDPGVAFVDSAAALSAASGQSLAGREYFYEHVHLNLEGNYLLARTIAEAVVKLLPPEISAKSTGDQWASFDTCSRRLALTDWDRRRIYDNMARRFQEPPFANQPDQTNQVEKVRRELAVVRTRLRPEAARAARTLYEEAVKTNASDFHIRGNYAKFLEDVGEIDAAVAAWRGMTELLPYEAAPYYFLGKLLARQKKMDEALDNLSRALAIRPDIVDALDEKGRLLVDKRRIDEALLLLHEAARLQPSNARIYLHLADAYAVQENRAKALEYLVMAVKVQPDMWEPHYFLGVELAAQNRIRDALGQFAETVRLKPDFALGRFNLGIALAKEGKVPEAIGQLNEAVRLDPKNDKAVQYLQLLQSRR